LRRLFACARLEFVQPVDDELRRLAGDPWKSGAVAGALRRVAAEAGGRSAA
jgi:hypothetical protein